MGFWSNFKKKREEKQDQKEQLKKQILNKTSEENFEEKELNKQVKFEEKRLKKNQKEREKRVRADKALLNSSLTFSKDIKKLSKKYQQADDVFFEELEEILIKTDMGMKLVLEISRDMQKKLKKSAGFEEVRELLFQEIYNIYFNRKDDIDLNFQKNRLNIFMVIGVNGSGKTTSVAKLANFYAQQNNKVLIAAADTFRAGAIEQLEEWVSTRMTNVDLFKSKTADPSSVVFDAIKKAQDGSYDLLIIDTAGRLQNKVNLMKELEKMDKVVTRFDKKAPHETLLIIDATTGQNGVIQAKEFNEIANITGIILTKMDGTSKGGIALAIKDQMNIPVKLVGVGEQIDDLVEFNVDDYIYGLTSGFMENGDKEDE